MQLTCPDRVKKTTRKKKRGRVGREQERNDEGFQKEKRRENELTE